MMPWESWNARDAAWLRIERAARSRGQWSRRWRRPRWWGKKDWGEAMRFLGTTGGDRQRRRQYSSRATRSYAELRAVEVKLVTDHRGARARKLHTSSSFGFSLFSFLARAPLLSSSLIYIFVYLFFNGNFSLGIDIAYRCSYGVVSVVHFLPAGSERFIHSLKPTRDNKRGDTQRL
jgi:hypothetical protein